MGGHFAEQKGVANHWNPFPTFALLVITFTIPLHLSQGWSVKYTYNELTLNMPVLSVVLACAQILVFIATIQWLITSSMMRTDKDHEDLVKGVADQGLEGDQDSSASLHQNENNSDFWNL